MTYQTTNPEGLVRMSNNAAADSKVVNLTKTAIVTNAYDPFTEFEAPRMINKLLEDIQQDIEHTHGVEVGGAAFIDVQTIKGHKGSPNIITIRLDSDRLDDASCKFDIELTQHDHDGGDNLHEGYSMQFGNSRVLYYYNNFMSSNANGLFLAALEFRIRDFFFSVRPTRVVPR
jgi:hypothetical protein